MINEEHKKPIELTQLEVDLLNVLVIPNTKFESHHVLMALSIMGNFKGVKDVSMRVEDILTNCKVVK